MLRVNVRFLYILAVEKRKSVVGTILVAMSTNWIFTIKSMTLSGSINRNMKRAGGHTHVLWRKFLMETCKSWWPGSALGIAVQKGNRNHGMIVLLPTLKDEADLGFKYNTWVEMVSITKTAI
jgi:hypothetical protein